MFRLQLSATEENVDHATRNVNCGSVQLSTRLSPPVIQVLTNTATYQATVATT